MHKSSTGPHRPNKKIPRWAWATLLLVYIIALYLMFMPKTSAQPTTFSNTYIQHTVSPGETLYGISRMYHPNRDWREVAWEIQQASGCTALIRPGDVLLVPGVE